MIDGHDREMVRDVAVGHNRLSIRQPAAFVMCVAVLVAASVWAPIAAATQAQSQKTLCKKIRQAIAAGRTLDEIVDEFHTDVRQIAKCTQKRGKRRAPKAKKRPQASAAKPETRGSSTGEKPSGTPSQRAPRPRRPGPVP